MRYAEEHEGEELRSIEDETERMIREHEREMAMANPRRRRNAGAMLTYGKSARGGFRAALVDPGGKELGAGTASTRTTAMYEAAMAAVRAGHKGSATSASVLKDLSMRDAERVRQAAGLRTNPKKRGRKLPRRKNHPLPGFRDFVVHFLESRWGKSPAEAKAAAARHANLVEGSWTAGENAGHVAKVIAKAEGWRARRNPKRPPRAWMRACTKAVGKRGKRGRRRRVRKPGAVCAATFKRMAPGKRRRVMKAEERPNPSRRREALLDAEARGMAKAFRRMGYRVRIRRAP